MTPPYLDRVLPDFGPDYFRLDVTRGPHGDYDLRVFVAAGPGFCSAADSDLYDRLTAGEVVDVADAVLSSLLGL